MINIYYLHQGDNVPVYIGETSQSLNRRLNNHKRKLGTNLFIELVDIVSTNEWRFWESFYISLFKSWGFILINKNKGGGGMEKGYPKHTSESKQKIGNKIRGRHHNDETKLKQSISNTGISRNKNNQYAKGHKKTEEGLINIGKLRSKPIYQLNKNNDIIKEWNSIKEASLTLKIQSSDINNVCKNKLKSAGGFRWIYKLS